MSAVLQTFKKRSFFTLKEALPVSQTESKQQGLRRRLSSLSLKLHSDHGSSPTTHWAFCRSKSVSSMADFAGVSSLRKWWDWSWAWIVSRKPTFFNDVEMNGGGSAGIGYHNQSCSWKHVFDKVRSELRRLVGSDNVGLPQTFRYDEGKRTQA